MKKSFKIGALALAMSALLFSCADPNNNTNNSSKKAVNSMNDAQTVIEEISYDLGYSFGQTFSELASNQDFQTDIISKVLGNDGKPTLPINLDLANKQYNVTGLKLNIEKGKEYIAVTKDTNNTTYSATTDIVEEVIFDGSKLKVKDQIGYDEPKNEPIWSEPRDNKITSAVGSITLKATDVAVTLNEKSMPTAISGEISDITIKANAKFDTGTDGYAGNINLDGNVVASDLKELYNTITKKLTSTNDDPVTETINKLITYNNWLNNQNGQGAPNPEGNSAQAEPAYPTQEELTAVYEWIDTLNATVNAKISFTDVNNANPFYLLKVTKLSELAKMYTPQKLSK